jgi:hypothetical protein
VSGLYYVNSGYWDAGYAEGEDKSTGLLINATLSTTASAVSFAVTALDVAASATATTNAERVALAGTTANCSATTSVSAGRIHTGTAAITAGLSATAVAAATRSGDLDFSANLSVTPKPDRLLKGIAFGATSAIMSVNGRLKWERDAATEEIWVPAKIGS